MTIEPFVIFEATSAILLVVALVFLVLWLIARFGNLRQRAVRKHAELDNVELRISLDEQTARLRIIRELHEVTINSVSLMISQADGAKYSGDQDPTAAVRAVAGIADAARSVRADMRRVMTVVREGEADVAPQPRLKSARELFRVMREAGLVVEFEETGDRFEMPHGAEVTVYRILQESLSNALKFGGDGTEARVTFTWAGESLQVRVDDDGVRAAARRAGLDPNEVAQQRGYNIDDDVNALTEVLIGAGITEMRERTALFGGVFHANALPGVGFSVSAVFPDLKHHNGIHGVNLDA
ncbi:MAG: ATP-binding protein [Glaciihabitans sp.]|nr:ATP-binding protein [Glaciihabitans sp.]